MGRRCAAAKGPRLIDLDLLLFGDVVIHAAGLEIPHPRMFERRFVLEPLAELAPALRPPRSKHTVREMLEEGMDQPVRRLQLAAVLPPPPSTNPPIAATTAD